MLRTSDLSTNYAGSEESHSAPIEAALAPVSLESGQIDAPPPDNNPSDQVPLLGAHRHSPGRRLLKSGGRKLLYAVPIVYALNDADTISTIKDRVSPELAYTIAAVSFVSSVALYLPVTVRGMKEAFRTVTTRHLPEDWHRLSRNRELTAAITAGIISAYIAGNDGISSFYFAEGMPAEYSFQDDINKNAWFALCTTMGILTGTSLIFSEGFEVYQAGRDFLATQQVTQYHNRFSRIASPAIGYTIGTIGFFKDSLIGFIGITDTFSIRNKGVLGAIAATSIMPGVGEFTLTGRFVREQVNAAIKHVDEEGVSAKDVSSLLITTLAAGLLAYANFILIQLLCNKALNDFNVNSPEITDPIVDTFSALCTAQEFTVDIASLQPASHYVVNKFTSGVTKLYNKITGCCLSQASDNAAHAPRDYEALVPNVEEDDEVSPLLVGPSLPHRASPAPSDESNHGVVIIDMQASDYVSSHAASEHEYHSDSTSDYRSVNSQASQSVNSLAVEHDFSSSERSSIYSRPGSPVFYQPIAAPRQQLEKAHSTGELNAKPKNLRRSSY